MAQIKDIALLKQIATVLKEIRLEHTLTQNDVYYDTGIHIGRIESYKVNLSIATLSTLCKYFEISLVDFFNKVEQI
jgi:transcriptional regulator with XRE-family HTH domain